MSGASDIFSIETETTVRFAEHEIFLSFTNDDDAILFYEWLNSKGKKAFVKWRYQRLDEIQESQMFKEDEHD